MVAPSKRPSVHRERRGARARLLGAAALAIALVLPQPVGAAGPAPEQPDRDPNDAPLMRPPNGQLPPQSYRREIGVPRGYSSRRRIQLTALPLYAAFRTDSAVCSAGACFIGRPRGDPLRGGGVSLELDIQVWRFLWLRVHASHTAHPVREVFDTTEEDEVILIARSGTIQASNVGLGIVYGMDLGRIRPLIDAGAGAMFIRSPNAAVDGQFGAQCRPGGVCDLGLVCATNNRCEQGMLLEVHAGLGLDVLVRDHLSFGAQVRYHALLSAPDVFPVYLTAALRAGLRF